MSITDLVGGLPLLSVVGTPRAIGEAIGERLKPRLQLLAQYLSEQVASGLLGTGQGRVGPDDIRRALQASREAAQRLEPGVWMELESIARATGLPCEDILLIHGWTDLLLYFRTRRRVAARSTYIALSGLHTDHGGPRAVLAWHLDAALMPYLTLVRRIPAHGPGSLALTVAGVHPVAGMSEVGLAVAANALLVEDGAPGHLTTNLVAAALASPDWDDACHRIRAGPRHAGACLHLLDAQGRRCSLELSGQHTAPLADPWPNAPRVHCNLALSPAIRRAGGEGGDDTSRARLARIAALAVEARAAGPDDIVRWFHLGARSEGAADDTALDGIDPACTVVLICDPELRRVHALRGGAQAALGSAAL